MASNNINTVNIRPKRANAGQNSQLEDFTVFGLAKKPTEKTIKTMKWQMDRLYGPNKETCPRKRRIISAIPVPVEETIMVEGGQFGHPDSYFQNSESEFDSDATTEISDSEDSASTKSDPMEGIEPAEGTFPDEKRKFKCDRCEMYYEEQDLHEERNVTDDLHLLCYTCFISFDRQLQMLKKRRLAREKQEEMDKMMEEIVWPENAQVPEKSITSGLIDLTIGPDSGDFIAPDSGDFWRYETDSNIIVID
jgi:hypothetical protein